MTSCAPAFERSSRATVELDQIIGAVVGQVATLDIPPDLFDRIEVWGVWGQVFDMQPIALGGKVRAELLAAMGTKVVPNQSHGLAAEMPVQNLDVLRGELSPLQAQIDLALPPNRGLPDAIIRINLAGLREAGYDLPPLRRVGRSYGMPGGET